MKPRITVLALLLLFCIGPISAQQDLARGEEIVMSTEELTSLARKMAQLRAQRMALYQQRQAQWQAYYAQQQTGVDAGARSNTQETHYRSETEYRSEINRSDRRDNSASPYDNAAELEELRRRLDRQEQLLLEIRDNGQFNAVAKSAAPAPRDTAIQRILGNEDPNRLTRDDLRRLTDEVSDMNEEMARLRSQVEQEENRRQRAEDRMNDVLRDDRRRYDNDRDRRIGLGLQPVIQLGNQDRSQSPAIIRDTVFVDRNSLARTDTVVKIQEVLLQSEPEYIRDTVKEEVVRTETVQLAAQEPIGFPTIFFDNNSATLNATHRNILFSMLEEMRSKGSYNVRLTGYASKSGNAAYNQELSARRAEAVKQGLAEMGISADRIRMIGGGIDFQAATPAGGRRVEIQAIPQ
ncbi:OmpA family protein [Neolewinella antarctica]|uniref:Outer membrane protein OmpA-like peptidoglycan-associated protein n=1 Tax=Neolewinella antarctica TaxID=442734 RepID=A0ABX0XCA9_9BACT|nr:OmpA family protein [Neolewinella antarctica]NJC26601.1 outer membrane protein OmpA-like peptidoglycan-associated protein [Neolewinella antarctica]